jgi:hypothetical protein
LRFAIYRVELLRKDPLFLYSRMTVRVSGVGRGLVWSRGGG